MPEQSVTSQHNPLFELRYKLSVIEQRLVMRLVAMIEPDDGDFKQYDVNVSGLANAQAIGKAVDGLMDTTVKFDEGGYTRKAKWLSSSLYQLEKGIISLRVDPTLKPLLLQLKKQLDLSPPDSLFKCKKKYSTKLYELLKPYQPIGKRRFSVAELRQALGVGDGKYGQHRDFRRWVINDAQAELQEKADIRFEYFEMKRNKTVMFIDFIIRPNHTTFEKANGDVAETVQKPQTEKTKEATVWQLVDMGVAEDKAVQLVEDFSCGRIDLAIAYAQEKHRERHVKKLATFVVVAIEKGLADPQAEEKAKGAKLLRLHDEQQLHGILK